MTESPIAGGKNTIGGRSPELGLTMAELPDSLPPPLSELNFEQVSNDIRISSGRKKDLLEMKNKCKNLDYFCYRIKKIHSYNIYITANGARNQFTSLNLFHVPHHVFCNGLTLMAIARKCDQYYNKCIISFD